MTERTLHVGPLKHDTLGGESIEVGGLRRGVLRTVGRLEIRPDRHVQVVDEDEQDVGRIAGIDSSERRCGRNQITVREVLGLTERDCRRIERGRRGGPDRDQEQC